MEPMRGGPLTVPVAIVVAGGLIAAAIFLRGGSREMTPAVSRALSPAAAEATAPVGGAGALRPIDENDHIRGNPDADLIIVEYSDTECPFCKRFHGTMQQVIDEYGKAGKVAWVYRHFPIVSLHPKAPKEAEALECAGELGGNTAFWEYADEIFRVTPSNDGLAATELPAIAERVGLRRSAFEECVASGRHAARVERDYADGIAAGVNGTPYSVLLTKDGKRVPLSGAQPFGVVKQMIDELLTQ